MALFQSPDAGDIFRFARAFHQGSVWAHLPFDQAAVARFLVSLEDHEDGILIHHKHGAIGGIVQPLWFCPGVKVAAELFWFSESNGAGRELLAAFEAWAQERGADYVQMSAMADAHEPALRRIMRRVGYTPAEIGFAKAIQWPLSQRSPHSARRHEPALPNRAHTEARSGAGL